MVSYFIKKENILKTTVFFTIIITLLSLSVTVVFSILIFSSILPQAIFISILLPIIIFPLLLHSFFTAHFKIGEIEKKLHMNLQKDAQTGIWNRHYFLELAEREFFIAKRYKDLFSILICEIDNIKEINEKHGHTAGDKIICGLAGILDTNIRTTDIAARYESKRVVLLLPKIDSMGAAIAVERVKNIINRSSVMIDDEEMNYSVSVGFATFEDEMEGLKDILSKAEKSLEKARQP